MQKLLLPTKYFENRKETLSQTNIIKLNINDQLSIVHIFNNENCFKTIFILVKKNINTKVILRNPFLTLL